MKLNRLLFLYGLLVSTGLINAQTDFRPGFVVSISGDTLYGEIDYRGDLVMSSICKFKAEDNNIVEYSPEDISAYRFSDSKYYLSREINHKKVFLEFLIKGKINIYYMRDNQGDHYYLDKDTVDLTEIPFKEGINYINDNAANYKTREHTAILFHYMKDAPNFNIRVQNVKKPDHQSLIKLAKEYHDAVGESGKYIIFEKMPPILGISFEPFAGMTNYSFYDEAISEFGGYFYFWAPRSNERLFFKTGLIYHKLPDNAERIYKIPVQVQYIYRVHKIQPHISGGFNIYNLKLADYWDVGHSLSLNAGLNYRFLNKLGINAAFNSDYIPLTHVMMHKEISFKIISYSVNIGLRIDF